MAESGSRPTVRVSQKLLSIVLAVLGMLGCIVLGIVWWDSVENFTGYTTKMNTIIIGNSSLLYESRQFFNLDGYVRGSLETYNLGGWPLFTRHVFSNSFVRVPIYLLILAYLATLLLIWLVLMNRLARRDFTKTISTSTEE